MPDPLVILSTLSDANRQPETKMVTFNGQHVYYYYYYFIIKWFVSNVESFTKYRIASAELSRVNVGTHDYTAQILGET